MSWINPATCAVCGQGVARKSPAPDDADPRTLVYGEWGHDASPVAPHLPRVISSGDWAPRDPAFSREEHYRLAMRDYMESLETDDLLEEGAYIGRAKLHAMLALSAAPGAPRADGDVQMEHDLPERDE